MNTIVIDCRFAGGHTGLGRYTREITRHLLMREDNLRYVLLVRSVWEEWLTTLSGNYSIVEADIPHYSIAEQMRVPRVLKKTGADLLFSPHFNVPLFCPMPYIVTIHDLILHRYPNNASLPKHIAYQVLMKHAVLHAKKIIAISEFVKQEIQFQYPAQKNITVIYEGVAEEYKRCLPQEIDAVRSTYQMQRPYFLYVGNAKEHKNVRMLIDAFTRAGDLHRELILVSSGAEARALQPLPQGVRLLQHVPDADLPALYSGAQVLVTASLYEGFCLPLAEALACGCPVVASNTTAIAELGKGKAMLIEPTVENFAAAFQATYSHNDPVILERWEQTAAKTAVLFHELLHI